MNTVVKIEPKDIDAIPFQEASLDIWDKKYRLDGKDGTPIDKTMDETYQRVARALADVERADAREHWYERFLWALRRATLPAARHLQRRGARSTSPPPDHQLHRLRHDPRLDGRHPEEGPRGGADTQGGLRHRL